MIYSPPQHVELRYRPSYAEIADTKTYSWYQETAESLVAAREGSEYVRRTLAEIEVDNALKKLSNLKPGWDTYGGEVPSKNAVASAKNLAKTFISFGLIPDAVTPSAEGGVAICFVKNQKYADIECFNSGETLGVRYSSQDNPKVWAVEPDDVASGETAKLLSEYLSA